MQLFVIGETDEQRREGAEAARTTIEGMLQEAQQKERIKSYEVEEIDLQQHPEEGNKWTSRIVRRKFSAEEPEVYVPIFHNADNHPNLAQELFDSGYRGVIVVSPEGYDAVTNKSKRGTFSKLHCR